MNTSDHERCSELLAPHLRGDLDAAESLWVDDHLASCPDCRAEEVALRTLASGDAVALSEIERARLRRGVLAAVTATAVEADAPPAVPRGGRVLQLLGAAALLLIIGVFMYSSGLVGGGLGGGDEDTGGDAATSEAPAGRQDEALEAEAGAADAGAGGGTTDTSGPPPPEPSFRRSMGEISGRRLNRLGRSGLPLVIFSRAYSAEQVPELQAEFRDRLAIAAGRRGDVVRECSDLVTEAFPHSLPAYGALATLENLRGRQVLVLAFAWTDKPSGPLDQSMVWAWPADNCDQPVEYYKNVIQPER